MIFRTSRLVGYVSIPWRVFISSWCESDRWEGATKRYRLTVVTQALEPGKFEHLNLRNILMLQFFSQLLTFTLPSLKKKTCKNINVGSVRKQQPPPPQQPQQPQQPPPPQQQQQQQPLISSHQPFWCLTSFVAPVPVHQRPSKAHQRSLSGPYSLGEAPTPGLLEAVEKSIEAKGYQNSENGGRERFSMKGPNRIFFEGPAGCSFLEYQYQPKTMWQPFRLYLDPNPQTRKGFLSERYQWNRHETLNKTIKDILLMEEIMLIVRLSHYFTKTYTSPGGCLGFLPSAVPPPPRQSNLEL